MIEQPPFSYSSYGEFFFFYVILKSNIIFIAVICDMPVASWVYDWHQLGRSTD